MKNLIQVALNLGPAKLGAMAGITVALLGFFIFLTTKLGATGMTLLYGNIDANNSSEIQLQLAAEGFPFELRENGTQILVPTSKVDHIRLKMAEMGLGGSIVGYELFDSDKTLGSSSFMQEVNRTRALEGELSRTIASLSNVKSARVHLVLPKRELFSRETQEPSASIILKMKGAQRLDRTQISAIQHLTATAVQHLKPSMISIVDDRGTLLAKGGEEGDQGAAEMVDMRSQYEARIRKDIEQLLERTLGFGKVRVEVRADMDFTQTAIREQTYDPDGQVLRSTSIGESNSSLSDRGDSTVSVGNTLPDTLSELETVGGTQETESSITETSNYEISTTTTNIVKAPGKVNSLSVAVLVDGIYERDAQGEDNQLGEILYKARSAEEMQQLETLVKSTMGFDSSRGDTVEIVNMQFAESTFDDDAEQTYFGLSAADVKWLAQTLILGMLAVLVILLVVRPLIGKLLEATPNAIASVAAGMQEGTLITDQSGHVVAVAGAPPRPPGTLEGDVDDEEDEFNAMIDLAHIEGRIKVSSMKKIAEIIDKHPEEAVSIIRNWMNQDRSN